MDIIELARQIGKEIQQDERYLNLQKAEKSSDSDQQLQDLIGDFNLKRMAINNEAQKENRDEEKLQKLNQELRECYSTVMQNPNMIAYQAAKQEMEDLLKRVNAIIMQSAEGEDPETTDYVESCGGNCGSCGGCH
ncbi:MAG: YlbF family regulator [Clostridiales bacterium]|jgi:cell fate (sporulation/competence/biofilm development) regulator YlbF (YheA/YmcA/DUF963 family)|nr:YlbF family regulator [Clostridiales bacterium]